jgi:type I restriction enzyme S subunit
VGVGEWVELALGDVLEVKHGFAFKGEYFGEGGEQRLVTPGNFFERGGFRDRGTAQKSYSEPIPKGYELEPGAVVVAMTEQSSGLLGSSAAIPDDGKTWLHNQRIGLVVPDPASVENSFIYYLLNEPTVRGQISATATGTKVRHTAPRRIEAVRARFPPVATQRRIAAVLSAFDELIEINERRIELLEDLARSIYREWFVRFRFPGHEDVDLVDSELGPIPEGWVVARLDDLAYVVVEGVHPSELEPDSRYVGLEHVPRRRTTLRDWGSMESVTSRKLLFSAGDTLFGKIRPYFHKVAWAPFGGAASSDTIVLRAHPDKSLPAFVNTVTSSDELVGQAVATSNGTKMPRADPKALLAYQLPLPGEDLLFQFERTVRPWIEWSAGMVEHNRQLATTRDLLLPRLVTGRLDISDVDLGVLTPTEAE